MDQMTICPKCNGEGEDVVFITCKDCKGTGEVELKPKERDQPYDMGSGV